MRTKPNLSTAFTTETHAGHQLDPSRKQRRDRGRTHTRARAPTRRTAPTLPHRTTELRCRREIRTRSGRPRRRSGSDRRGGADRSGAYRSVGGCCCCDGRRGGIGGRPRPRRLSSRCPAKISMRAWEGRGGEVVGGSCLGSDGTPRLLLSFLSKLLLPPCPGVRPPPLGGGWRAMPCLPRCGGGCLFLPLRGEACLF
jgi:hypothetical protein